MFNEGLTMDHYISVIFAKQLNESKRDIVLDTMINTARVGLTESSVEYELYENDSNTILRLPLAKPIKEDHQQAFVEALANRLFDKGHTDFEIELTEATLRSGSRGEEVRALQAQLGMPESEQDGIFGPRTEQALRAFQQRAGIQVDGIAGGQTQAALAAGGAPRNAGAARPATQPFTPGGGSTTQAPPAAAPTTAAPTTAAPQTSPRPPARPQQPTAGSPQAPTQSPRPQARPQQPAPTGGLDDTQARATIAQQRADQQAAAQRRADQRAAAQSGQGATASGAQGDGLRGGPAPAPQTATGALRARQAGQPAPTASSRPDPNDPRGNQIAPPSSAAPQAQTTAPAQPSTPAAQGALAARVPGTDFAQQGRDATRPTTAPTLGQPPAAPAAPAVDTTPAARPATGQSNAPVQPVGQVSSSRPIGVQGSVRPGDETNALDALAADAQTLGQTNRTTAPTAVDTQAQRGAAVAADNPQAPGDNPDAVADIGPVTTTTTEPVAAQGSVPTDSQEPAGAGQNIAGLQQQWQQLQGGGDPDAITNFVGGLTAVQKRALGIDPLASTASDLGLGPTRAQAASDRVVDQRMDRDASAAPAAGAAQALGTAMRGFGTDEEGIATALQGLGSQQEWEQVKASYDGDLLADLQSELNRRDYRRYVTDVLQAAGIQESAPAKPKGAFMFRERAEWDELFGKTHNKDGSVKTKNSLLESRKYNEVTYHDDDQFFEDYGVMWYNDDDIVDEAEYRGRKVKLGKPMKGDVKKFKVYVKNPKGNVVKVNFGQKGVKIKKSNPERRRSFRARHNCDNPGPRHKARYWSCRKW